MTYLVQQTSAFAEWHSSLKDMRGKIAIARRIERAARGNLGDVKAVGEGLSELRVDVGPGYRLYFVKREKVVIVLLAGGDKSTQQADIRRARKLAKEIGS
ncbi:type II toxin-antitoxin system RelE/ParE family toxin [Stutzerimonas nitrititolerans]|uniref:type II toxin-antitoxin system RelE/ParE family toxin n=1 Tax=Stutzerimonas nitrititolerans TaxID=2482751 RepID=UPI0028A5A5FE|nr:type II toxin-antitoxin system RelE/ParE family toxin [Stutzerimonas nitrititolerans]